MSIIPTPTATDGLAKRAYNNSSGQDEKNTANMFDNRFLGDNIVCVVSILALVETDNSLNMLTTHVIDTE